MLTNVCYKLVFLFKHVRVFYLNTVWNFVFQDHVNNMNGQCVLYTIIFPEFRRPNLSVRIIHI